MRLTLLDRDCGGTGRVMPIGQLHILKRIRKASQWLSPELMQGLPSRWKALEIWQIEPGRKLEVFVLWVPVLTRQSLWLPSHEINRSHGVLNLLFRENFESRLERSFKGLLVVPTKDVLARHQHSLNL